MTPINKIANGEDSVSISQKTYIIRFSAKHAQHIVDNRHDKSHNIDFRDIVYLIKNSVMTPFLLNKKRLALGRHNGSVYEIYFILDRNRLDVVTAYKAREFYRKMFEDYENETANP